MENGLSDIEFDILNAIYFVEPFAHILEECKEKPAIVSDVLKKLIDRKMVVPMQWDENKAEYIRSYMYDSDNMHAYYYLATKDGLMAHNSR